LSGIEWQYIYPQGLDDLLRWLADRYRGKGIWLAELGVAGINEDKKTLSEILNDVERINYLDNHIQAAHRALNEGNVPLECILVWSLLDNWEWQYGYGPRFGVVSVDYNNGTLARNIKRSGFWLKDYFSYTKSIVDPRLKVVSPPRTNISDIPPDTVKPVSAGQTPRALNSLFVSIVWILVFAFVFLE
jgi:beta-glucosidase/6-phospho-beta-glucosidase/beta-galactosidase